MVAKEIRRQLASSKKKVIETDQDRNYVVTGGEGTGKSTLAQQLSYELDPTFNIDRIYFNSQDFAKGIRSANRYTAHIFDEAFNGLSSKGALSKENKNLVRLMMECRQRNLFIFIVLPSIFLLEKYIALFRSHALFHTAISKKDYKKRYFKVYNRKNKHILYLVGKKMMSYSKPYIMKKYRFYPGTIIDKEAYGKKKLEAFRESEKRDTKENEVWKTQRDVLVHLCHKLHKVKYSEMARWFEAHKVPLDRMYLSHITPKTPKSVMF